MDSPDRTTAGLPDGPTGVLPRLAAARQKIQARDIEGASAIYEEVLASAGDRADVLVTISGDLGSSGNVVKIIELVAPRYDAARHGPATGLNILQAYLAVRNLEAAQHVLDILFSLNRPELEERLYGFSNAIADLMADVSPLSSTVGGEGEDNRRVLTTALVTFSKPAWYYGLDELDRELLPERIAKPRKIAFAQLDVPKGYRDAIEQMKKPEDELSRLARGIPLYLCEPFYFSPQYQPVFATGIIDGLAPSKVYAIFPGDWVKENIQRLVDETEGGIDYIFSGSIHHEAGDFELELRLFEVKKFRERKAFSARWNPATADETLAKLHSEVCTFMEWSNPATGFRYTAPARPLRWTGALSSSVGAFLIEKGLLAPTAVMPLPAFTGPATELEALVWLTYADRARKLGLPAPAEMALPDTPLVKKAREVLGS